MSCVKMMRKIQLEIWSSIYYRETKEKSHHLGATDHNWNIIDRFIRKITLEYKHIMKI